MAPEPDRVFAEPWEATAFALAVRLSQDGVFTWAEWSEALGARIAASQGKPYYQNWLETLEALVAAKGLVGPADLAARRADWAQAYRDTPHGKPVALLGSRVT